MFKIKAQALRSYFAYTYTDFKKTMTIGVIICACTYLLQIITALILSLIDNSGISSNNSGMLITGFGVLLISFMIGVFVDTSNGHMKNVFRFPINRPAYALGNLIYILLVPLAMIAVVSIFQVLEVLTFAVLSSILDKLVYLNLITVTGYLDGILPSYATAVFALSLVYLLSMYFHRFKLGFVIGLSIFFFFYIFLYDFRIFFNRLFAYPFTLQSRLSFSLYMLGISIGFHVIAFIPLKFMEVKS